VVEGRLAWVGLGAARIISLGLHLGEGKSKSAHPRATLSRSSPGGQDDLTRDDMEIPVAAILARVHFALYAWQCKQFASPENTLFALLYVRIMVSSFISLRMPYVFTTFPSHHFIPTHSLCHPIGSLTLDSRPSFFPRDEIYGPGSCQALQLK